MKRFVWICLLVLIGLPAYGISRAADQTEIELIWSSQDGGGRKSDSDLYSLEGTIGQVEGGGTAIGRLIGLSLGYWVEDAVYTDLMAQAPSESDAVVLGEGDPLEASVNQFTLDAPVTEFALLPITPNPIMGHAQFAWTLPRASYMRLAVYDVQGRELALLADGLHEAGRHTTAWNAATIGIRGLGICFIRLQTEGGVFTQRAVVIGR